MGGVLLTFIFALVLALAAVANAIAPATSLPPWHDEILAILVFIASILWVRSALAASRHARRMQEMAMTLETANIKLTQLDRLKSEFLSFASHQIKAPMTVVKGYATLILDGSFGAVSPQVAEVAGKIKDSADRMIALVNTFLDLRRLDEGRMTYQFESVDLGRLTASVVDEMQQLAAKKSLKLTLAPQAQSWRVRADLQHLRQVIANLVENAIKYTDQGSVTITLSAPGPDRVRLAVADTGRGISPQLLPKLFEQFSRDQSIAKEIAGTGLGLYIAKKIVEAHDGRIWAESPGPGQGSTFIVELPVIK